MQISVRLLESQQERDFARIRTILAVAAFNYVESLGLKSEVFVTVGVDLKLQANDFRIFLETEAEKRIESERLYEEAWKIFGSILHEENHYSFYRISLPIYKTRQPAMA